MIVILLYFTSYKSNVLSVTHIIIHILTFQCLVYILSCHEWDILTVEGIGNHKNNYDRIQRVLAEFNGSQCGYCSPGWVMNMYRYISVIFINFLRTFLLRKVCFDFFPLHLAVDELIKFTVVCQLERCQCECE